jgi:hypothetical protein
MQRLTERKKMVIRGEEQTHALNGRPSNNRKKPETLQQFMAFVKANRYLDPTDPSGNKYRLKCVYTCLVTRWPVICVALHFLLFARPV